MQGNPKLPNFLTVPETAKVLKVTREAVVLAIKRGRPEAIRIEHFQLVRSKSVQAYQKTRKVGRPPKKRGEH